MLVRTTAARWSARVLLLVGLLLFVVVPVGAASAQTGDYPVVSTSTTSTCNDCGTTTTIQVKGASTLPFTGGNVALLTLLGVGAAGAGTALILLGRRSKATI
jgi:hypothetical protein